MNILENMMALSLQLADVNHEFAQDFADVVATYNPAGGSLPDNIEDNPELNRINQKWLRVFEKMGVQK